MIATAKRILLTAAFTLTALLAMQTAATAQSYTCIIVNGCKVLLILDPCGNVIGIQTDCGSNGSGTFTTTAPIPRVGRLNVSLIAQNVSTAVQDPTYGKITTSLDGSRDPGPSTIISNNQESRFPATGEIRFYANATISSVPGVIYTSRTPLVFRSTNLNSVDPFVNERFTLSENVDFYNPSDLSQTTSFTLQAGASSVDLGTTVVPPEVH